MDKRIKILAGVATTMIAGGVAGVLMAGAEPVTPAFSSSAFLHSASWDRASAAALFFLIKFATEAFWSSNASRSVLRLVWYETVRDSTEMIKAAAVNPICYQLQV